MPTKGNDNDIDSALNDLMIVSQMATTSTPVENKGKKSVRLAESHHSSTQHVSSGPIQTASGAAGSFSTRQQFYSYSSSSSSSSKQQVVSSSSSGQIELPAASQPERSIQHQSSGGVQASSSSSSQHHHHQSNKTVTSSSNSSSSANKQQVDYSRINQNAAGSLTQQQLDSPVCNFTVRSSVNPFVRLDYLNNLDLGSSGLSQVQSTDHPRICGIVVQRRQTSAPDVQRGTTSEFPALRRFAAVSSVARDAAHLQHQSPSGPSLQLSAPPGLRQIRFRYLLPSRFHPFQSNQMMMI